MLDIAALPIALALTLWDALPVFLCIAAAAAIFARVLLTGQLFHTTWRVREIAGIEGMVFGLLFYPLLVPALLLATVGLMLAGVAAESVLPESPLSAARKRIGEVFGSLLLASAVASVIKVGAPSLPNAPLAHLLVALAAGAVAGNRSGVAIIPAIAISVHYGGVLPAVVCIAAGAGRLVFGTRKVETQPKADTA